MVVESDVAKVPLGFPEILGLHSSALIDTSSIKKFEFNWREIFVPAVSILESVTVSYFFKANSKDFCSVWKVGNN